MGTWPDYETIIYDEQENGVAWVTLNRPERLNSFNSLMQRELRDCWSKLRRHDDVRCIVLTGAGDRAFCSGIDRHEQMGGHHDETTDSDLIGSGMTPFAEIMRLSLMGNYERMTAQRAYEIGLVSEVVPGDKLHDAAQWCADRIAEQPQLAIQGTVRSIWLTREFGQRPAVRLAHL